MPRSLEYSWIRPCIALVGSLVLAGCGGGTQDYGSAQSGLGGGLGGDLGQNYNSTLGNRRGANGSSLGGALDRGSYPMLETSFQLDNLPGDPFDFEKVSVMVTVKKADGGNTIVPAFFDGGSTWRMRFTPTAPGQYNVVDIKLNGAVVHESKLDRKDWSVSGTPKPGFVRIDRGNHTTFALDNGAHFYPLGHDAAWETGKITYNDIFGKMHAAGENWSRLWLDQRDGKHLEAADDKGKAKLGAFDLDVAKKWDAVFAAADKNDIYLQLVLENSDSFSSANGFADSSNIHPAWDKSPFNVANGGMLKSPDAFFVDPNARTIERRKLYYILARWGYSPNMMGIELFHDAQSTDAAYGKHWDDIALWHHEMALFVKNSDMNHHLLTTASAPGIAIDSPIWETVDYVQRRLYAADPINALSIEAPTAAKKLDKPEFVSEFGAPDGNDPDGTLMHAGLWTGLVTGRAAAAQYWDWENVEKLNGYDAFKAATAFVTAASVPEHTGGAISTPAVETSQRGAIRFGPGAETESATAPTEFVVGSSSAPAGMDRLSPVLGGKAGPKQLTFSLNCSNAGAFEVAVGSVSAAGAKLKISVDGKAIEHDFASSKEPHPVSEGSLVKADVAVGAHSVVVSNDGADWLTIRSFAVTNYAPALGAVARTGKDFAYVWVYNRDGVVASEAGAKAVTPATGQIKVAGMSKGKYRATWWDTHEGKSLETADLDLTGKEEATLNTPPLTRDAALYIVKAGSEKTKTTKTKLDKRRDKNASAAADTAAAQLQPTGGATGSASANIK